MRIRVLCEGKTKDEHLRALQEDYAARIRHFARLDIEPLLPAKVSRPRDGTAQVERWLLEKTVTSRRVVLDERGQEWSSAAFARWMEANGVEGAREVAFLIGGPDGFSQPFRKRADAVLALSRMTLTRDWARTLLLEQIYRSFTIQRGYPYAR